jgi:hypothetical protein
MSGLSSGRIRKFDPVVYQKITELKQRLIEAETLVNELEQELQRHQRHQGFTWLPWRHHTLRRQLHDARESVTLLRATLMSELIGKQS